MTPGRALPTSLPTTGRGGPATGSGASARQAPKTRAAAAAAETATPSTPIGEGRISGPDRVARLVHGRVDVRLLRVRVRRVGVDRVVPERVAGRELDHHVVVLVHQVVAVDHV